jgi:hypothetical protein
MDRQLSMHESASSGDEIMVNSSDVSIAASLTSRLSLKRRTTVKIDIPSSTLSSDLSDKLLGDVLVAALVTFGFSPAIAAIDRAIVEKAAGSHTILESIKHTMKSMAREPGTYFKSPMFLFMWGVYAATYSTANCLKTITEHRDMQNRSNVGRTSSSGNIGVFATTTLVNSYASILKDRYYAKAFGTSVGKVPLITYGLWGVRDCLVVGSAFVLPSRIAKVLHQKTSIDEKSALTISQLLCPVAAQFAAGPVHLLSLDLYNRPLRNLTPKDMLMERLRFQCNNFSSIVGARIARIAPAYGIGGVGNTYLREKWRSFLMTKQHA